MIKWFKHYWKFSTVPHQELQIYLIDGCQNQNEHVLKKGGDWGSTGNHLEKMTLKSVTVWMRINVRLSTLLMVFLSQASILPSVLFSCLLRSYHMGQRMTLLFGETYYKWSEFREQNLKLKWGEVRDQVFDSGFYHRKGAGGADIWGDIQKVFGNLKGIGVCSLSFIIVPCAFICKRN